MGAAFMHLCSLDTGTNRARQTHITGHISELHVADMYLIGPATFVACTDGPINWVHIIRRLTRLLTANPHVVFPAAIDRMGVEIHH